METANRLFSPFLLLFYLFINYYYYIFIHVMHVVYVWEIFVMFTPRYHYDYSLLLLIIIFIPSSCHVYMSIKRHYLLFIIFTYSVFCSISFNIHAIDIHFFLQFYMSKNVVIIIQKFNIYFCFVFLLWSTVIFVS